MVWLLISHVDDFFFSYFNIVVRDEKPYIQYFISDNWIPKRNRVIIEHSLQDCVCGACIIHLMRQSSVMMGCQFCGLGDETSRSQLMRLILFLILFTHAHIIYSKCFFIPRYFFFSICCCRPEINIILTDDDWNLFAAYMWPQHAAMDTWNLYIVSRICVTLPHHEYQIHVDGAWSASRRWFISDRRKRDRRWAE